MTGFTSVGVVGAGLIGGSVARRLHDLGLPVLVSDPDAATCDAARAAGLTVADLDAVAACDLVVLANPLDAMAATMAAVAGGPAHVVVDVGSVKAVPAEAARAAGLADRYVGVHPMSGAEASGFTHSDPALLVGVTWAVVFPDPAAAALLEPVVAWLVATFDAVVMVCDADEHDRSVALISHAPHVLAHLLLGAVEDAPDAAVARHLAAGSFRDGTRVAGRNPLRTFNMLAENATDLDDVLGDLVDRLGSFRDALTDGTLLDRLQAVADREGAVRRPETAWSPCADLAGLLAGRRAVLVRAGATGLESATP